MEKAYIDFVHARLPKSDKRMTSCTGADLGATVPSMLRRTFAVDNPRYLLVCKACVNELEGEETIQLLDNDLLSCYSKLNVQLE